MYALVDDQIEKKNKNFPSDKKEEEEKEKDPKEEIVFFEIFHPSKKHINTKLPYHKHKAFPYFFLPRGRERGGDRVEEQKKEKKRGGGEREWTCRSKTPIFWKSRWQRGRDRGQ